MASTERRHVALFALGGTIATPVRAGRAQGVGLTAEDLLLAVPGLQESAALSATTFRTTMSAALSLDDVVELAAAIIEARRAGSGIVVTMGTDSLEEVAYALDLLLPADGAVVVTGAMRNAGTVGADGPSNLLDAVRVASSDGAAGLGVLVVMHGEIHAARQVRKTHATSLGAFTSPSSGPVGSVSEGTVRFLASPDVPRPGLVVDRPVPPVALLRLGLGDDLRALDVLEVLGYRGLVLEVFGAGHVAEGLMPRLRAVASSMPVVFASRTGAGALYTSTGSFPGSESDLLDAGLESAGDLDGLKSRVLLSLALAAGSDWRSTLRAALV